MFSSQVIQRSAHQFKAFLPFSGYVLTTCYRLLFSKTCFDQCFSVCFYWTFLLLNFCFCWHYIIFFCLTYPCMIILKYNQTFGVLFFFVWPSYFLNLPFGSPLCSVEFHPFVSLDKWICTATPTSAGSSKSCWVARCCRSDQVFELSAPRLWRVLHIKVHFLACPCMSTEILAVGVPVLIRLDHLPGGPKSRLWTTSILFFFFFQVGHSSFTLRPSHTLETCFIDTQKNKNKQTKKKSKMDSSRAWRQLSTCEANLFYQEFCKSPSAARWWPVLCLYATWCLSWVFPEGVVSVLSMSYFAHKGDRGGGSRRGAGRGGGADVSGLYLEVTVASLSS